MPNALKASWQVHAGLIPGTAMPEYTRTWHYTSEDFAADNCLPRGDSGRFQATQKEARDYADSLQNGNLNWVNSAYVWY